MTITDEIVTVEPPRAPVEFRRAGEFEVRFADRIIEIVAVPYDVDAVVEYPPGSGRSILESVAPGSFDGVERRANRVKANRDHDPTRTVGRSVALHPSRTEGLVAEIRIARTPLGDETLELADDEVLEASVGMAVSPSWQQMLENRTRRRINKAFLDHIALLPNGAYGESAQVIAVRAALQPAPVIPGALVETPRLDEVAAWLYERQHEGR